MSSSVVFPPFQPPMPVVPVQQNTTAPFNNTNTTNPPQPTAVSPFYDPPTDIAQQPAPTTPPDFSSFPITLTPPPPADQFITTPTTQYQYPTTTTAVSTGMPPIPEQPPFLPEQPPLMAPPLPEQPPIWDTPTNPIVVSPALPEAVHHAQMLATPKIQSLQRTSALGTGVANTKQLAPWLLGAVGLTGLGTLGWWQRDTLLQWWRDIRNMGRSSSPTGTPSTPTPASPATPTSAGRRPPPASPSTPAVLTPLEQAFEAEAEALGTTVKALKTKRRLIKYAGMLIAGVGLVGTPVGGAVLGAIQAGGAAIAASGVIQGTVGAISTAAVSTAQVVGPVVLNPATGGMVAVVAGGGAAVNPRGMDGVLRGIGTVTGKTTRWVGNLGSGIVTNIRRFLII